MASKGRSSSRLKRLRRATMSSSRSSTKLTSYVGFPPLLALRDLHAIEARRQCLDRLQHRDDLRVLLLRDLTGDKDAEVADVLVHQADDHLSARLDFLGAAVHVGDPVEGLLRRRDVVAERREQDDRNFDLAQVEGLAGTRFHRA